MGVIQPDFMLYDHYVRYWAAKNNKKLNQLRMLELGNQRFQDEELISRLRLPPTVKEYWESNGVHHVSIDLNGEDGALKLDLCKPLPEEFYGSFDIVTNCGTSEHVDDQYECWKNIHRCLKKDGFLLCAVPEANRYNERHCEWFYDTEFFEALSTGLSYRVHMNGRLLFPVNGGYVIFAALEKTGDPGFNYGRKEFENLIFNRKNLNSG